jgi:hypothetical protein
MKNIFLVQTDKPSRLVKIKDTFFLTSTDDIPGGTFYNIYITSDEKIKERDYVTNGKYVSQAINEWWTKFYIGNPELKADYWKIILTDNEDLIKDGVQEISEDFLQWFVQNSDCEEVEVKKVEHLTNKPYRVTIPKEELKFEDSIENSLSIMSIANDIFGKKEEPKQEPNFYEKLKEYFENTPREKVLEDWNKSAEFDKVGPTVDEFIENSNKEIFKNLKTISSKDIDPEFVDIVNDNFWGLIDSNEKTIEEVANKLYPENWESIMEGKHDSNSYERNAFIAGYNKAKEQSKNKYSEEDMREAIVKASLSNIDDLIERCDDILRQFNKK